MKMFVEPGDIYLHTAPVDFRKSVNGLLVIIETELDMNAFTGALFLFTNRKQDKLKCLFWDKTGFALYYKRLEKHKFKWPKLNDMDTLRLTEQQLNWLLGGYDVIGHQPLYYNGSGL